jgi:modulator of FtsH protease HflK
MSELQHNHGLQELPPGRPETLDSGSQALSEALRSSFGIVKVVMVFLILLFIFSGVFQVKQGERAIKLRFGRPVRQGEAALIKEGLHWSWPYPIEEYV